MRTPLSMRTVNPLWEVLAPSMVIEAPLGWVPSTVIGAPLGWVQPLPMTALGQAQTVMFPSTFTSDHHDDLAGQVLVKLRCKIVCFHAYLIPQRAFFHPIDIYMLFR